MLDFRRLQVWQSSRELVVALHPLLRRFSRDDHGVLAGQLRRAALSIPSCIAEGCGAGSRPETLASAKSIQRMLTSLIDKIPTWDWRTDD